VTPLADPLDNIVVVLDEPQKLVNIAGVVRAMNNMGLKRLRLVRPAEFDATRISGIAHRSEPLVEATERFDTLEEAVADATFVLGASARARTAHRNYGWAREWGPKVVARAVEGGPVALLFGREDRGLSNQGLDLCNGIAIIPTDEEYSSLNLAQAFLILAYEIFIARQDDTAPLPSGRRATPPAPQGEIEQMYRALQNGLDRIEFFKSRPPENVMRTLRTLLARAEPDRQEAGLVQAVGFEIGHYLNRLEEK
jgi:TrmH family RNA methyltransferase